MPPRLSQLRWPLTAATAGMGVLWAGSMVATVSVWWGDRDFWLVSGALGVAYAEGLQGLVHGNHEVKWVGWANSEPAKLKPSWQMRHDAPDGSGWLGILVVPLWMLMGPAAVGAAWAFRAHARRTAGGTLCPRCGYPRAGLAAGAPCPECSASPTPAPPPEP